MYHKGHPAGRVWGYGRKLETVEAKARLVAERESKLRFLHYKISEPEVCMLPGGCPYHICGGEVFTDFN